MTNSRRGKSKKKVDINKSAPHIANIIECEGDTVGEAREILISRVPFGYRIESEKIISDGRPATITATGSTTELAFTKARTQIPSYATILEERELISPNREVILVKAYDQKAAGLIALKQANTMFDASLITVEKRLLVKEGRKGFLGIGKRPGQFNVTVSRQSKVEIHYETRAKIVAKIEVDYQSLIDAIQWGDEQSSQKSIEALVKKGYPAIKLMVPLLGHENENARNSAGKALLKLGTSALDFLYPILNEEDSTRKKIAEAVFIQICMEHEKTYTVSQMIRRIKNINLLQEIALKTTAPESCSVAIEGIKSLGNNSVLQEAVQSALIEIANNHLGRVARKQAIDAINSVEALSNIIFSISVDEVAGAAVGRIKHLQVRSEIRGKNDLVLFRIAKEHPSIFVRSEAVKGINNLDLLFEIARSPLEETNYEAIKSIKAFRNAPVFADAVMSGLLAIAREHPDLKARELALPEIDGSDLKILKEILFKAEWKQIWPATIARINSLKNNPEVRDAALSTLSKIALEHPDVLIGKSAIQLIDDPEFLFSILHDIGRDQNDILSAVIQSLSRIYNEPALVDGNDRYQAIEDQTSNIPLAILRIFCCTVIRCRMYKMLTSEFIDRHYYKLGPKYSQILVSFFLSQTIENKNFYHSRDIYRLIYLSKPTQPRQSKEGQKLESVLDASELNKPSLLKRRSELVQEINETAEKFKAYQQPAGDSYVHLEESKIFRGELLDRSKLEKLAEKYNSLKKDISDIDHRLSAPGKIIEERKEEIKEWLSEKERPILKIEKHEQNTLRTTLKIKQIWGNTAMDLFFDCANSLEKRGLLYESSCFCDAIKMGFENILLPQSVQSTMIMAQANFLKSVSDKSTQLQSSEERKNVEVLGPTYLTLQNNIETTEVSFLIVGPTIDQIILNSPNQEGINQTSIEIQSGKYTIICDPKDTSISPLVIEGYCLPGRYYPIGIAVIQNPESRSNRTGSFGDGFTISQGLFGIIAIEPLSPLQLVYDDKRYQIKGYLGEGSGGSVYRAIDELSGQECAFKSV
jgi:uncharacterized membrane-anchored protein YhcB (DUF1043 family)